MKTCCVRIIWCLNRVKIDQSTRACSSKIRHFPFFCRDSGQFSIKIRRALSSFPSKAAEQAAVTRRNWFMNVFETNQCLGGCESQHLWLWWCWRWSFGRPIEWFRSQVADEIKFKWQNVRAQPIIHPKIEFDHQQFVVETEWTSVRAHDGLLSVISTSYFGFRMNSFVYEKIERWRNCAYTENLTRLNRV